MRKCLTLASMAGQPARMDAIDRLRAFNRFYTGWLGVLGRSYLGSGLGLTEVRVLHDLDREAPVRPRDLARALGLDEGYLSRMLAALARRGWVVQAPLPGDRRTRAATLTPAGRAVVAELRGQSRTALARAVPGAVQAALVERLEAARALIEGGAAPVVLRGLAPGDAGWIVSRHGALYARDEGFDATFEALVAEIVAGFLRGHDPARERGWIAAQGEVRQGSIFCVDAGDGVAKLRLFLVEPEARGTGLAQRMLETCLVFAREAGYRRMRLWTHESHRAAGRIYARNGFALTAAAPARSFGQDVVEQTWERAL